MDHHKLHVFSGQLQNDIVPQIKSNLQKLDDAAQQLWAAWDGQKKIKFMGNYNQWVQDNAKLQPTLLSYSDRLAKIASAFAAADTA